MSDGTIFQDSVEEFRSKIAEANGFQLYGRYDEASAAEIIGVHAQTLKQMRLQGRIQFMRISARKIAYFGYQIADYLIGTVTWANPQSPPSESVNIGSPNAPVKQPGIGSGTTPEQKAPAAHRLARQSLKKPSSD